MAVANSLVYNSRLQCGSEEVATARLSLPLRPSSTGAEPRDWLERIIAPEFPVLFLDTDNCETAAENEVKGQICNHFEANVTAKLVLRLLKVTFLWRCMGELGGGGAHGVQDSKKILLSSLHLDSD